MRRLHLLFAALLLALTPAYAASHPKLPTNADCLACHNDNTLTKDGNGKPVSLFVDEKKFAGSVHSSFTCVDCHKDITAIPHQDNPLKPACSTCHTEQQQAYDKSLHAHAINNGNGQAANCTGCHGSPHEITPSSDLHSHVNRANIAATCGSCHGQRFVMEPSGHNTQEIVSYEQSVHGKAVQNGSQQAAVCTDCHGTHEILPPTDVKSPIYKSNVPMTCGKCHDAASKEYLSSTHGQAVARGNWQAPVCTDCHGIHSILAHTDPNSPVSAQQLAGATCARCHEGVALTRDFGVPGQRGSTYLASYHGLASRLGSPIVANCASCHGGHNILPSSDPKASTNSANLMRTCGQCHPGANSKFALSKIHVGAPQADDIGSLIVGWIRRVYLLLILAVIGGMLLHNAILIYARGAARCGVGPTIVRMDRNQRIQHLVLLLSFFMLVVTGFALKYPESWLAHLPGMREGARGIVHRLAAVTMTGIGVYHLMYLILTRDGRRLVTDLLPGWADARDAFQNLYFHLTGRGPKPEFPRFTYAEKAEYWALVWGIIVMVLTGMVLWAKVSFGHWLPRWWLDAATAIHFYEAVLATLAIIVWHFYQVIFDPEVYPMNLAWWHGKMPLHRYQEEHARDEAVFPPTAHAAQGEAGADEKAGGAD